MVSAARTRVDAGVFASSINFMRIVAAAEEPCWSRAVVCPKAARRAARKAASNMLKTLYAVAALFLSFLVLPTWAGVTFDVASIKVNTGGGEVNNRPAEEKVHIDPGSLTMTNVTLITCLKDAYRIYAYQISAPTWMNSVRYDITAKAAGPVSADQLRLMLQALLAERFHMRLHHVRKELNVYSLAPGKRGHKLREAAQSNDKAMEMVDGAVVFRSYSIKDFIAALSDAPFRIGRPVRDMTGLEGKYDFELKIAPDSLGMKNAFEGMLRDEGDGPSVIALVQEQLGLRFTAEKASVAVLAVDSADKTPTAN
jgi:uncharacterized protein (TIGR03435 family)